MGDDRSERLDSRPAQHHDDSGIPPEWRRHGDRGGGVQHRHRRLVQRSGAGSAVRGRPGVQRGGRVRRARHVRSGCLSSTPTRRIPSCTAGTTARRRRHGQRSPGPTAAHMRAVSSRVPRSTPPVKSDWSGPKVPARTTCSPRRSGSAQGPVPPTATFSAAPASIESGQSATVTWNATNATTVSINQGIGTVTASGTRSVIADREDDLHLDGDERRRVG